VTKLAAQVKADETAAASTESTWESRWSGANFSFLSQITGKLPNQTTSNSTGAKDNSTSDGWQTGGRGSFNSLVDIVNALVGAVNTLQQNLQNKNLEF
jgi:hypothetical protein